MKTVNPVNKSVVVRSTGGDPAALKKQFDNVRKVLPVRPGATHCKLSSHDMPIVRTSGDLAAFGALLDKVKPVRLAKSGSQVLKAIRAARERRR